VLISSRRQYARFVYTITCHYQHGALFIIGVKGKGGPAATLAELIPGADPFAPLFADEAPTFQPGG